MLCPCFHSVIRPQQPSQDIRLSRLLDPRKTRVDLVLDGAKVWIIGSIQVLVGKYLERVQAYFGDVKQESELIKLIRRH